MLSKSVVAAMIELKATMIPPTKLPFRIEPTTSRPMEVGSKASLRVARQPKVVSTKNMKTQSASESAATWCISISLAVSRGSC